MLADTLSTSSQWMHSKSNSTMSKVVHRLVLALFVATLLSDPIAAQYAPLLEDNVLIRNELPGRPNPGPTSWVDSYSVGDSCYCSTNFDHGIGIVVVDTPLGRMTIREVCTLLGPGPGRNGRPMYNDIQCGNGPPNDAGDETDCPGRTEHGQEGCKYIGPKWNFEPHLPSPVKAPMKVPVKAPVNAPVKVPIKTPVTVPVPIKVPVSTPLKIPVKMPIVAPVKAPLKVPANIPVPVMAPVKVPMKAPVPIPVQSPVKLPVKLPMKLPVTLPVKIPVKAPTRAPFKTPVKVPAPLPVKAPVKTPMLSPVVTPYYCGVQHIILWNARTGERSGLLVDGTNVCASSSISIQAISDRCVDSMELLLIGPNNYEDRTVVSSVPYFLYGSDGMNNIEGKRLSIGSYAFVAVPDSEPSFGKIVWFDVINC